MILIDASHLFFRNFHMNKKDIVEYKDDIPTGEINEGYLTYLLYNSVLSLVKKFKGSETNEVVIALDSKPSWRNAYYVENSKNFPEYKGCTYKGDRKRDDDGIPFDKILNTFKAAMISLQELSDFIVVAVDLAEADDIIAVLARQATDNVYICSGDKDFHQLQTNTVHLYDPIKKIIKPKMDTEVYKQIHFMVAGDDNIKQCRSRLGKKTAEKLLPVLNEVLQTNPDFRNRYEFNKVLIDFDNIPEEIQENIKKEFYIQPRFCYNSIKMLTHFAEFKLKKMVSRLTEFKTEGKTEVYKIHKPGQYKAIVDSSLVDFFN